MQSSSNDAGGRNSTISLARALSSPQQREHYSGEPKRSATHVVPNRGEDTKRNLKHVKDRVSGLKLLVAAIILWNTTYLQRAVDHLRNQGHHPASGDMAHLSPLGWEHINLTGDYHWDTSPTLGPDEFRPLRTHAHDFAAAA